MKTKILLLLGIMGLAGAGFSADVEADITPADVGETNGEIDLTLNAGAAPFIFDWSGPDGFSSSEEDLTGLAAGTYTVTVTDSYCGTAILEVEVEDNSTNVVEEEPELTLSLYPNPTSGWLYLKTNTTVDVNVYNVVGELIFSGNAVTEIDLSNQPAGLYMVEVRSEMGTLTRKVTLQ